jgi:hypothetical protein
MDIPVQHPASGGPSDGAEQGYAVDEYRPRKVLRCSWFMDVHALPYVDFELFMNLKMFNMAAGTTEVTHQKLHRQASAFLQSYRVNDIPPELLAEVLNWTVLAAMIPTDSEMLGIKMMSNKKVYKQINIASRFKRDGESSTPSRLWGLIPGKLLSMRRPKPV